MLYFWCSIVRERKDTCFCSWFGLVCSFSKFGWLRQIWTFFLNWKSRDPSCRPQGHSGKLRDTHGTIRDTRGTPRDTHGTLRDTQGHLWNPQGHSLSWKPQGHSGKIYTFHGQSCIPTPTVAKARGVPWAEKEKETKKDSTRHEKKCNTMKVPKQQHTALY